MTAQVRNRTARGLTVTTEGDILHKPVTLASPSPRRCWPAVVRAAERGAVRMIRQTATGMEQFCASCLFAGEPYEDCWLPLAEEFFPKKNRGTRKPCFEHRCKTCKEMRRQQRRASQGQQQECRA